MDMNDHDNTAAARILYAIAMESGCANSGSEASPFVYDEEQDAFCFPDGRFAVDRERVDPRLAKALRLGLREWVTPRLPSGVMLPNLSASPLASPEEESPAPPA
jgi:hypothetical protein